MRRKKDTAEMTQMLAAVQQQQAYVHTCSTRSLMHQQHNAAE
jgi:hypothetical protein